MMDDKAQQLVDRLHDEVKSLVSGADWTAMLKMAAKFHTYSASNILLILAQRPDASQVAGFKTWRTTGRTVMKGEKGIAILAPMIGKKTVLDPETGREKVVHFVRGFRVVHVFDIAQTSGPAIAAPPQAKLLTGEAPPGLEEHITSEIKRQGFTVNFPEVWTDGAANGWARHDTKEVAIKPGLSPAQRTKTLTHELGHVLLHDGTEYARGQRGRVEVEAESVAFVVCQAAGLETDDYSLPYVAGWSGGDMKLVLETASRVIDAATKVLFVPEALSVTA